MPKLIIVIGLPGSGKSYYIKKLLGDKKIEPEYVYDDFHANAHNDSSKVTASRYFHSLIEGLKNGKNCLVSDIAFCKNERMEALKNTIVEPCEIELHCFENNPTQCKKNIAIRARESANTEMSLVNSLTCEYQIPEGAKLIPVYDNRSGDLQTL